MATFDDLLTGLITQLTTVCASITSPAVEFVKDTPPVGKVQNLATGTQGYFVSLFQHGDSSNVTRYMQHFNASVVTNPVIAATASAGSIAPNGTATVTLSNTPILNDAVGVTVFSQFSSTGQAANIGNTDPLTANFLAGKLAAAINADSVCNQTLHATVLNAVVTLTNLTNQPLQLYATAGNIATTPVQRGNELYKVQMTVYARTYQDRFAIGELIRQWIFQTQFNFGIQLVDGSWTRLKLISDLLCKDQHLNDIYMWHFVIESDLPVIIIDNLYSILYIGLTSQIGT